jgi:hypothetical protein
MAMDVDNRMIEISKRKLVTLTVISLFSVLIFFSLVQFSLAQDACPTCGEGRGGREPITTIMTTTPTTIPVCGNGIINSGEQCEYPNTVNNVYCPQTTSNCQGNKTGTRDSYGNCNSVCGCVQDPFTYSCVKNSCGAECAVNSDCPNKCVGLRRYYNGQCGATSCSCSYTTEDCSPSGWYNTTETRWVTLNVCKEKEQLKQEYRESSCTPSGCTFLVTNEQWVDTGNTRNKPDGTICGTNTTACPDDYCFGSTYYNWIYNPCNKLCTGGVCGKCNSCSLTSDTCSPSGCCDATCDAFSGCGLVQNNANCPNYCSGSTRYYSGSCGSGCGCNYLSENCNSLDGWYDTSTFTCDGSCRRCKAQEYRDYSCAPSGCTFSVTDTRQVCENSPAGKHCVSGNFTNVGYCSSSDPYCGDNCNVKIKRYECNGDNQCNHLDYTDTTACSADTSCSGGVCSSSNSCGSGGNVCTDGCDWANQLLRCNGFGSCTNFWKFVNVTACNPYTCFSGSCTSTCDRDCGAACDAGEQETRNVSCTTSQGCPGTKLQKRVCLVGNCQFGDWFDITTCQDVPGDLCPPVCGDGAINGNDQCEYPNTVNNIFCSQTIFNCLGNKTGVRDLFGNCNGNCQCALDSFTYACVKNSCGAECAVNSDCPNKCLDDNILLINGKCSGISCSCSYTKQNCTKLSGWVDTGQTKIGPCPDDACKTCGQKEQKFKEFFCGDGQCTYAFTDTRWVDVNKTVIKCPTGYYCSQGQCEKKECKGEIELQGNIQVCAWEDPRLHVSGLTLCTGKKVYFKEESCNGKTIGSCTLNKDNVCVRNVFFKEIGTPTVVACLDKNGDGDFTDPGEQASLTFNVNCNNCVFNHCPISQCIKCYTCGGFGRSNTNPYGEPRCLNPGEDCSYSCLVGSCGARSC